MCGLTRAFREKMLSGVPPLHIRAAELGTAQQKQQQWTTTVSIWGGWLTEDTLSDRTAGCFRRQRTKPFLR